MKTFISLIALTILSFGCASQNDGVVSANAKNIDLLREKIISPRLMAEPIPLPKETPYDSDVTQRETYLDGFAQGWKWGASGAVFHGLRGFVGEKENSKSFQAGWKDGCKVAIDRWQRESEMLQAAESSRTKSLP